MLEYKNIKTSIHLVVRYLP